MREFGSAEWEVEERAYWRGSIRRAWTGFWLSWCTGCAFIYFAIINQFAWGKIVDGVIVGWNIKLMLDWMNLKGNAEKSLARVAEIRRQFADRSW